ncbi:lytic transglycosylase domain-containing protein [Methylobacterium mesophilicum]|uniref:lytic transglycosylase domain-containing protein n=1 Tax=Methylobacterium mesophilicum TaxID=39956 RepID=UPI002F2E44A3
MDRPVAPTHMFGRRPSGKRGTLALCLVVSAALTPVIAPRASSTARSPAIPEVAALKPFAPIAAPPPLGLPDGPADGPASPIIAPVNADLMILGRGAFRPIEATALLFPQAGDGMRALITAAAAANGLPGDFFLRLLRQESGLNPNAVSPVGALGIAQFMPGTAAERGLRNPFDPLEAIPKSAELLREHRVRFGNLGLAAAAYNAGPQRVRGWLEGRSGLPTETRDYVVRITGRTVEEWAAESGRSFLSAPSLFSNPRSLGAGAGWPVDSSARPSPLFGARPVARSVAAASDRSAKPAAKRGAEHLSAQSQQPRSEQALCAVLNGQGRTCLVQAVY